MIEWAVGLVLGFGAGWWTCNHVFTRKAKEVANGLVSHLAECDRLHAEMDEQLGPCKNCGAPR